MRPLLVVLAYALALFAILYFFVIVPGQKRTSRPGPCTTPSSRVTR